MNTIFIILAIVASFSLGFGVGNSNGYWKAFNTFKNE